MIDNTVLKMNILGGMNEFILREGDEDVYAKWIEVVPDCCTEEDLEFIANDKAIWVEVCELFTELIQY